MKTAKNILLDIIREEKIKLFFEGKPRGWPAPWTGWATVPGFGDVKLTEIGVYKPGTKAERAVIILKVRATGTESVIHVAFYQSTGRGGGAAKGDWTPFGGSVYQGHSAGGKERMYFVKHPKGKVKNPYLRLAQWLKHEMRNIPDDKMLRGGTARRGRVAKMSVRAQINQRAGWSILWSDSTLNKWLNRYGALQPRWRLSVPSPGGSLAVGLYYAKKSIIPEFSGVEVVRRRLTNRAFRSNEFRRFVISQSDDIPRKIKERILAGEKAVHQTSKRQRRIFADWEEIIKKRMAPQESLDKPNKYRAAFAKSLNTSDPRVLALEKHKKLADQLIDPMSEKAMVPEKIEKIKMTAAQRLAAKKAADKFYKDKSWKRGGKPAGAQVVRSPEKLKQELDELFKTWDSSSSGNKRGRWKWFKQLLGRRGFILVPQWVVQPVGKSIRKKNAMRKVKVTLPLAVTKSVSRIKRTPVNEKIISGILKKSRAMLKASDAKKTGQAALNLAKQVRAHRMALKSPLGKAATARGGKGLRSAFLIADVVFSVSAIADIVNNDSLTYTEKEQQVTAVIGTFVVCAIPGGQALCGLILALAFYGFMLAQPRDIRFDIEDYPMDYPAIAFSNYPICHPDRIYATKTRIIFGRSDSIECLEGRHGRIDYRKLMAGPRQKKNFPWKGYSEQQVKDAIASAPEYSKMYGVGIKPSMDQDGIMQREGWDHVAAWSKTGGYGGSGQWVYARYEDVESNGTLKAGVKSFPIKSTKKKSALSGILSDHYSKWRPGGCGHTATCGSKKSTPVECGWREDPRNTPEMKKNRPADLRPAIRVCWGGEADPGPKEAGCEPGHPQKWRHRPKHCHDKYTYDQYGYPTPKK